MEELKKLLIKNIDYSKMILESTEKTRKYIMWLEIINMAKIILIIVPIILGIIYGIPFFQDVFDKYGSLMREIDKVKSIGGL